MDILIYTNFTNATNSTTDLTPQSLPPDQLEIIYIVCRTLCSFSLAGLVFVQIVFWFFRSIRTFAFELVAWLCLVNIIFNITFLLPIYESDNTQSFLSNTISNTCIIQGFMNLFSDLSSMMWTTIIGYTAFISVANQDHLEKNKKRYRMFFILGALIIPLMVAIM